METFGSSALPSTMEGWTASMRGSLAKTLALLEHRMELEKGHGLDYIGKSCELLMSVSPDGSSLRTVQQSLDLGLTPSCTILPCEGTMRNGCVSARLSAVRHILGTDGGSSQDSPWPTPSTKGYGHASEGMVSNLMRKIEDGTITKLEAEQMLHLPKLENHRTCKKLWPTPRSCSAMESTITPEIANNEKRFPNLETVVGRKMWPTPTCNDAKNQTMPESQAFRNDSLAKQMILGGQKTQGMVLNANWVEWLQGWPIMFTASRPSETDKSH